MSKKLMILGLVLALAAALAAPAGAAKKKGPKPFKSETITTLVGHPVFNSASETVVGVTPQEFINRCALPASNGLDAAVFEVPADYQKITSQIEATGVGTSDAVVPADVDIYLFDSSCADHGKFNAAGTSESGVLSSGTAFVLLHNYVGGSTDLQFTLKPVKL